MSSELSILISVFVLSLISAVILTLLAVRHGYWMCLDFFTEDRKSVAHRRQVPERTLMYKCVNLLTFCAIFWSTVMAWNFCVAWTSGDLTTCRIAVFASTISAYLGKVFVYLVYIARLHLVYKGSQYGKDPKKLSLIGATISFILIFLLTLQAYNCFATINEEGDEDSQDDVMTYTEDDFIIEDWIWSFQFGEDTGFYKTCIIVVPPFYMSFYGLTDILANFGFTIAFVKPIRDVIGKVQGSSRNIHEKSKMSRKMLFVGFKVALLSVVLFLSSIIAVFIYIGFDISLFAVDFLINSICLALMTPYYPDKIYYQNLCKCCIFCCDRNGYTTGRIDDLVPETSPRNNEPTVTDMVGSDRSDLETKSGTGPSADTMSAIRIAAKEENPLKADSNDTEMELATHLNKK